MSGLPVFRAGNHAWKIAPPDSKACYSQVSVVNGLTPNRFLRRMPTKKNILEKL